MLSPRLKARHGSGTSRNRGNFMESLYIFVCTLYTHEKYLTNKQKNKMPVMSAVNWGSERPSRLC